MDVTWDPAKAKANLRKHGVRFSDAETVLGDPFALSMEDRDSSNEYRHVAIGRDALGHVLVVVYTVRDDCVRRISARKATRIEKKVYEEGI